MKKKITSLIFFLSIFTNVFASKDDFLKIGPNDAKVVVKVFSSLTCPHCADFHENIFYDLKSEFIDKEILQFQHHSFPLDLAALNAEKIIRCTSNNQQKFQLLGEIYKKQNKWAVGSDINKINKSLVKIGLNNDLKKDVLEKCLKDESIQDRILTERINAQKKYKISSTPTIYVNDKKYEGKNDYISFKKYLKKFL